MVLAKRNNYASSAFHTRSVILRLSSLLKVVPESNQMSGIFALNEVDTVTKKQVEKGSRQVGFSLVCQALRPLL